MALYDPTEATYQLAKSLCAVLKVSHRGSTSRAYAGNTLYNMSQGDSVVAQQVQRAMRDSEVKHQDLY